MKHAFYYGALAVTLGMLATSAQAAIPVDCTNSKFIEDFAQTVRKDQYFKTPILDATKQIKDQQYVPTDKHCTVDSNGFYVTLVEGWTKYERSDYQRIEITTITKIDEGPQVKNLLIEASIVTDSDDRAIRFRQFEKNRALEGKELKQATSNIIKDPRFGTIYELASEYLTQKAKLDVVEHKISHTEYTNSKEDAMWEVYDIFSNDELKKEQKDIRFYLVSKKDHSGTNVTRFHMSKEDNGHMHGKGQLGGPRPATLPRLPK